MNLHQSGPTTSIEKVAVPNHRDLLSYEGDRMWLRADLPTKKYTVGEGFHDGPPLTRAQAKASAMPEISTYYDWCALRCRKVWLTYDPHATDEEGATGCWVASEKGAAGAVPWWEVSEKTA